MRNFAQFGILCVFQNFSFLPFFRLRFPYPFERVQDLQKEKLPKKKLFLIDQENKDTHLWNIKGETLDELVQGGLGAAVRGGHVEVGLAWKVPASVMTLRLIRISAYHLGARGNHRGSLRQCAKKYSIIHLRRQTSSPS